jgi:lysophospholipase L1-like esterase
MSRIRRPAVIATSVLLAGSAGLLGTVPAAATAPSPATAASYVALGDSYASGGGTRAYIDDGTGCQRSVYGYPSLIAAADGFDLNLRACSGATVADVARTQLDALDAGTGYVTISAGGNDAGFAAVLTECAQPAWSSDCNGAVDGAEAVIDNIVPGWLSGLYAGIRARAPQATVVVVGYPRLFDSGDCNAGTWFSPHEQARLNAAADLLDARLSAAASAAGFGYLNPTTAFVSHAVCEAPEWLNGLSMPINESYHPNRAGHSEGYAPLVSPVLTGGPLVVTADVLARAEGSTARITDRQRGYATRDAGIRPEVFVKPDLDTPEARAAGLLAGVDLGSRASIDAVDARFSAIQAGASGFITEVTAVAAGVEVQVVQAGRQAVQAGRQVVDAAQAWGRALSVLLGG